MAISTYPENGPDEDGWLPIDYNDLIYTYDEEEALSQAYNFEAEAHASGDIHAIMLAEALLEAVMLQVYPPIPQQPPSSPASDWEPEDEDAEEDIDEIILENDNAMSDEMDGNHTVDEDM